jgi:hypothetical protein
MLVLKDKRVELSKDVFDGIKSIKYLGWEKLFENKIMQIRKKEFCMMTSARAMDGFIACFWNSVSVVLLYFFLKGNFSSF